MRILVPLDSSTFSQAAQRIALQLAEACPEALLYAIHVVNVRTASGNLISDLSGYAGFEPAIVAPEIFQAHTEAAQAMVDQFVNRAIALGLKAEGEVLHGQVTESIIDASDSCDLVVMGLRGESEDRYPGQGGALASNALASMDTTALLVPRTVTRIRAIAVGYDGSSGAKHALRSVAALEPLGVPLHLIHVGDVPEDDPLLEAESVISESLRARTHRHYVSGESIHGALVAAARSAEADVLALGFRGADPLKDALFGSAGDFLLEPSSSLALLITR